MDFSPYRKTSNPYKKNIFQKIALPLFLGGAVVIGFFLFWGAQQWNGGNQSTLLATFDQNGTTAQTQVNGMSSWARLSDQSFIAEGDRVRITEGNGAKVTLGANSDSHIILGEDSEVLFKSLQNNTEKEISGEIVVEKGPVLIVAGDDIDTNEKLNIWGSGMEYITIHNESILIENDIVHAIEGESIQALKENINGKIELQKTFGIGQSLNLQSFSLFATPDKIEYSPLITGTSNIPTPSSAGLAESGTLQPPTLISPEFSGTLISVNGTSQKITGTAPNDAEKILVAFEHNGITTELFISLSESLSTTEKEWEYLASTSYETLKPGINTYNIYSIDAEEKRSAARVLVLEYKQETEENIYSESTGEFLITAPNQGRDTTVTGSTVTLSGTASSDTAFITVNNTTIGSSYTLQQYSAGQKTWKYWTSSLKPGTYNYSVQAKDSNKKVIATQKITITLAASTTTKTTTPTPKATTSTLSATSTPTQSTEPTTPAPSPTSTPSTLPAINTSSKEASRENE